MAQYVARFIPGYSNIVAPLQSLTHRDQSWQWQDVHQKAFLSLKEALSNTRTLKYFSMDLVTELIVDASPVGLAAILTQKIDDNQVSVVEYASRRLTDPETRYSQTEKEALAVVWACEHFHIYLYGAQFKVVSDHKPLEGIMNNPLSKPTSRLERLCLRLQPYKMDVVYKPGKFNTADFLSRHPRDLDQPPDPHKSWIDSQAEKTSINALHAYCQMGLSHQDVREATKQDPKMLQIMNTIRSGKWESREPDLKTYKMVKDELSIVNGLILRGDRIVIPPKLQKRAIQIAHRSHQGIVKTKNLLRETIWFPGIDRMVEAAVNACLPCQAATHGPKIHEPLKMSKLPEEPWQEVSMDFNGPFKTGEYLLVVIDDYSRFPEVEIVHSTSVQAVIPKLDAIFGRQGIPDVARTDNGPPFNSEMFKNWSQMIGMRHRKVTPLWPKANGEAERFMKTLEKAVKIAMLEAGNWRQELNRFLRHYRATPHSTTGRSPAELLYGRKIKTELPMAPSKKKRVRFDQDAEDVLRKRDARCKQYMKELADARNHARERNMNIGDQVLVAQETDKQSTPYKLQPYTVVAKKGPMLTVQSKNGHTMTRNSSFFKKIKPQTSTNNDDDFIHEDITIPKGDGQGNAQIPAENQAKIPPVADAEVNAPPEPSPVRQRRSTRNKKRPAYLDDFVI